MRKPMVSRISIRAKEGAHTVSQGDGAVEVCEEDHLGLCLHRRECVCRTHFCFVFEWFLLRSFGRIAGVLESVVSRVSSHPVAEMRWWMVNSAMAFPKPTNDQYTTTAGNENRRRTARKKERTCWCWASRVESWVLPSHRGVDLEGQHAQSETGNDESYFFTIWTNSHENETFLALWNWRWN